VSSRVKGSIGTKVRKHPFTSLLNFAIPSLHADETATNATPIAEIFLPSYADYHFDNDLETRRDPVTDIIVTDEEVGKMFPE
jgi:hypothetical protein